MLINLMFLNVFLISRKTQRLKKLILHTGVTFMSSCKKRLGYCRKTNDRQNYSALRHVKCSRIKHQKKEDIKGEENIADNWTS